MKKIFLLIALAIVTSGEVFAKMYKWVDGEGNVHYTQTPPPKTENVKKQDALSARGYTVGIAVTEKAGFSYCSFLQLPGPVHDSVKVLAKLKVALPKYQEFKQELDGKLENITDKARADKLHEEKNVYECAINWSVKKQKELAPIRTRLINDAAQKKKALNLLEEKRNSECWTPTPGTNTSCEQIYQSEYERKKKLWQDADAVRALVE